MTWHLDDEDYDEIASTFADLGGYGSVWDEQCERVAAYEDRGGYMAEARAQRLPEAQRWRERENKRRREDAEHKRRDAERKVRERREAKREAAREAGQQEMAWAS